MSDEEEMRDVGDSEDVQYVPTASSTCAASTSGTTSSSKQKKTKKKKQTKEVEVYEPGILLNALYTVFGRDEKKDESV